MAPRHHAAVLGSPIGHSLSPVLHQAAYRFLGLDGWEYGKAEVDEERLDAFLQHLNGQWVGLSLTMPLKRSIIPYGTPRNLWARELGVANTAVFDWRHEGSGTSLYNTDVYGIARAFEQCGAVEGTGLHGLILGNGNTAASAMAAYASLGCVDMVSVVARHPDRNPQLSLLGRRHGLAVDVIPLENAPEACAHADLAVNTIPAGGADQTAARLRRLGMHVHGTLLDVVYDPRPTPLMQAWRAQGGTAIGGEWMLLYQAVAQVMLMTGRAQGPHYDTHGNDPRDHALEEAMAQALKEAL
ncbi:shikimate dehydrogenase [Bifidobacterium cuniculi]|uniref:Shikimate 5-dehydrogenase n=1 Tax=Bifidobacterium cuniculi TaxID=1688 RepID=A0A087B4Q1_9BIFI|nr:shikimate dehydrogenase [Bifidobacterium cuniculi]KFI66001.1 shikimate 5-dehydrogenase [Bifidobacterium cuniculi]